MGNTHNHFRFNFECRAFFIDCHLCVKLCCSYEHRTTTSKWPLHHHHCFTVFPITSSAHWNSCHRSCEWNRVPNVSSSFFKFCSEFHFLHHKCHCESWRFIVHWSVNHSDTSANKRNNRGNNSATVCQHHVCTQHNNTGDNFNPCSQPHHYHSRNNSRRLRNHREYFCHNRENAKHQRCSLRLLGRNGSAFLSTFSDFLSAINLHCGKNKIHTATEIIGDIDENSSVFLYTNYVCTSCFFFFEPLLLCFSVSTVLTVATDENTTSFPFRNEMETSLANLYDLAYTRANNPKNRARRAVTKNEITIQVHCPRICFVGHRTKAKRKMALF